MATNFDQLKLAVEAMSGGKNTILLDDLGMPSFMVKIPQLKFADIISGGTQDVHDAFICNSVNYDYIYIGKYLSSVVNSRAYSLPFKDPAASLNFDTARSYNRAKGNGWHLPTNALYSAIALWCKINGTQPHGNNNYGADIGYPYEKADPSMARDGSNRIQRTATGSGPDSWYHDYNSATGIADLNGNVWEWAGGLRIQNGEIQVIPYGNAMADIYTGASDIQAAGSTLWQALLEDGTFVAPGTANSLKYDWANSKITLSEAITTQADAGRSTTFETLAQAASVSQIAQRVKGLTLFPADTSGYNGDNFYINNSGERLPSRGGNWHYGAGAGVFDLHLVSPRSAVGTSVGFRSAFYGVL